MAAAAAFCVGEGLVLGEFVRGVRPAGYLTRPLLAVAVLAVLVGLAAALFRRWSVVAAVYAMAWIIHPTSTVALVIAAVTAGLIGYRIWKRSTPNVDLALFTAAGVFFAAGLVPVAPMMSWSTPARADIPADGPPQYVILLDGYPRADTLVRYGFDISSFIEALEKRGFDHYPDATSTHPWTHQTLSEMMGAPVGSKESHDEQRRAQTDWRLPDGFVAIAPPIGLAAIPNVRTLNTGGFTYFEAKLAGKSALGRLAGGWVMDSYRYELGRVFDLLATTRERRVFAHVFAPHFPILYDAEGKPQTIVDCWPACTSVTDRLSMPVEERVELTGGYVEWLNRQLVETIDTILERNPDAEIVVFSDHGGRLDVDDPDEWYRIFMASKTTTPDLFADAPHPKEVFDRLTRGRRR